MSVRLRPRRDVVGTVAIFAALMAILIVFSCVRDAGATTDECNRTIGAPAPSTSVAVEPGGDTPTDVGLRPDVAGVGGGQGPVTTSAVEPVSAPTINQLVALPEVRS